MTREIPLNVSLSGPDLGLIVRTLVRQGVAAESEILVDAPVVLVSRPNFPLDVPSFVEHLADVPFLLAAFKNIYPTRQTHRSKEAPPRVGFSDGHHSHGWACAFRGDGHDRLVSRRWLPFGPWQVHEGPNDTSLVQFYDLDADAIAARAQCVISHKRMGASLDGGFIWSNPPLPRTRPVTICPHRVVCVCRSAAAM